MAKDAVDEPAIGPAAPSRAMTGDPPAPASARGGRKAAKRREPLFAAVDLGTNNCRMLVARRCGSGFRVVDAYSRIVRLGAGLAATGELSDESMDKAVEALGVCAERMRRKGVSNARCVATEACRAASNGEAFLARVRDETGIDLEVITAEEEARLAVHGSVDLLDPDMDAAVVVDIGGGSTELCWVDVAEWRRRGGRESGGRPPLRGWSSMAVGVVTLAERFPEPRQGDSEDRAAWYAAMRGYAADLLTAPRGARRLRPLFDAGRAHMIGTSGTVTSVAGVHLNLPRYDRNQVDGLWMSHDHARAACARLASKDYDGRAAEPCIGTERADLVLAGCAILEAVMDAWPTPSLRVGDRGLREGMLLNLMRPRRRRGRRASRPAGKP
ncbi:MAG: Ppx/GppA phosphatase family protein [Pseudomonadota bacterium]